MKDRPELDVVRLHRRALRRLPESLDGVAPLPVPETCPFRLAELLASDAESHS